MNIYHANKVSDHINNIKNSCCMTIQLPFHSVSKDAETGYRGAPDILHGLWFYHIAHFLMLDSRNPPQLIESELFYHKKRISSF